MAILLIEAPLQVQELPAIPDVVANQCKAQNLLASGNAAGHSDPNDLQGLPAGPFPQILGWRPKGIGAMAG